MTTSAVSDGTGSGLLAFLDWAREKGELPANTATAYKAATNKILAIDDDWALKKIAELDVPAQFDRFSRKEGGRYSSGSLVTYRTRFINSVNLYLQYLKNPAAFHVPAKNRSTATTRKTGSTSSQPQSGSPEGNGSSQREQSNLGKNMVTYPFPLMSGELAYLDLPLRLEMRDADRLASFVKTLAFAPQPALPAASGHTPNDQ